MQFTSNRVTSTFSSLCHIKSKLLQISFAVPDDIYSEVVAKAHAAGIETQITHFSLSAEDAAQIVADGFDDAAYLGFGDFFQQLAGGTLTALALHAIVNGYLLHKGACQSDKALRDIVAETALSGSGIAAGLTTETILKWTGVAAGSPLSIPLVMAASISARGMARRIAARGNYKTWIIQENLLMQRQILHIEQLG